MALGISDESGRTFQQEFDEAVSCSYQTRMYGFAASCGLGLLFSILATVWLAQGNVKVFAYYYCAGSIISIAATCFLFGPCAQLKSMFAPIRRYATIVYLLTIVLTLFVAIQYGSVLAIIGCIIVQFAAYIYYCASYIPYGRTVIQACLGIN